MPGPPEQPTHGDAGSGGHGLDLSGHAAFGDAWETAAAVLEHLREEVGFRFWAVAQLTGQTYTILGTGLAGFPAQAGEQLPWTQTLCRQVLTGRAPRVAADVRTVPAYRDLAMVERWQVGAYLSAPLTLDGTTLYGTVCALDPQPQPSLAPTAVRLVDRQARLLSTLLAAQLRAEAASRRAERAEADALVDPLTGLLNRRGWQVLLEREEQRCRRYGAIASVLMVDLDGLKSVNDRQGHAAGDALLQRAAQALRGAVRGSDVVARIGGDEFAVLAAQTDLDAARVERDRLRDLLQGAAVPASVGAATRGPHGGLSAACQRADTDMYRAKNTPRRPGR